MRRIIIAILILLTSLNVLAETSNTNIEKFLDQKAITLYTKTKKIGEIVSADKKPITFDYITSKQVGTSKSAEGIQITIQKSKYDDEFEFDYIDKSELNIFLRNLKTIWNYSSEAESNEMSMLSARTQSGLAVILTEVTEEEAKETGLKRFVILVTGSAYDELNELSEPSKIDKIPGLAILPMEGIKDIVSILETLIITKQ